MRKSLQHPLHSGWVDENGLTRMLRPTITMISLLNQKVEMSIMPLTNTLIKKLVNVSTLVHHPIMLQDHRTEDEDTLRGKIPNSQVLYFFHK